MKTFLIACGGTGGHLSPGIALAEGLTARGHKAVLLISTKDVDSRLIAKYAHMKCERVPSAPFSMKPSRLARFLVRQSFGLGACRRLISAHRPDAVIAFGGFTSAPVVLAARLAGVPVALHEANRVPGRAVRMLARFASRVYLPPGIRIRGVPSRLQKPAGLPVRREFTRHPREAARLGFGLDPVQKTLVVLGGSQGAQALNQWVERSFPVLASHGIQVCCISGSGGGPGGVCTAHGPSGAAVKAVFMPFCDRVPELLSAADLVVSRAGAGTIAELICCEVPAILVPYPHAADAHQCANARHFEQQGGGIAVDQRQISRLLDEVLDSVFNDWLLQKFRTNLRRLVQENSLERILDDLEELSPPSGAGLPAQPQGAGAG